MTRKVVLWEARYSTICRCKWHFTAIIICLRNVQGAEILPQVDIVKRLVTRAHQLLSLLAICQGEEVRLRVEPTVGNWLVRLLLSRLLDR